MTSRCPICGKRFDYYSKMKRHIKKDHKPSKPELQRIVTATETIKQDTGVNLFPFECIEIKPPNKDCDSE